MKHGLHELVVNFVLKGPIILLGLTGASVAAAAGLTLSVALTPLTLPIFVAEKQGYFEAEGITVTLKESRTGVQTMQQLADDEADLATSSDTTIAFNSFKRNDFVVLASFASSARHIGFIVGKSAGYSRPEHLAGKRIGMVPGSAGQYYGDSWLVLHGVDPRSTRQVSLQPEAMATAMAKGEVDAVVVWDPYQLDILKTVPDTQLLPNPGNYTVTLNLVADRRLVGKRDDELAAVLRALLRAEKFIHAEPAKAQAILREHLKLDQEFIDWIWPKHLYRVKLDQSLLTTLESVARWARQEGHVSATRAPNYLDFIYPEPLRKARPERVGIGR